MAKQKMWTLLVHLTKHWLYERNDTMPLEQDFWVWTLESAAKAGFNTILIDTLDGVVYESHPEIAMPGAWSMDKFREELRKCRELGLNPIPKLNFSANHCRWLGPYKRMISTDTYYRVVTDLIKEVYELFDHPAYIHIGMDEEDNEHANYDPDGYCMYRKGNLYWHDLRYIIDAVKATGAKPWLWYDTFIKDHDNFVSHVDKNEVLIAPWYYHHMKEEDFFPFTEFDFDLSEYAHLGLKYVEDIPHLKRYRDNILKWAEDGYQFTPCAWALKKGNIAEQMEYYHDGAPEESFPGMIVSTWETCTEKNRELFESTFKQFAEAKQKCYPET